MTTIAPEPRFARVATLIADPTRARMLAVLLGGEHRSAGELARCAGITAQSASTQLAQLVDERLLVVRAQGRHKYFALADADVAHALEALALLAERDTVHDRWHRDAYRPLKCARRCYGHLAGELGVSQLGMMLGRSYLEPTSHPAGRGWQLTDGGIAWVESIGMVLPAMSSRFAYPCLDWSERRDHLAGDLARVLLAGYVDRGWLRGNAESRALDLTPSGKRELLPMLDSQAVRR